MKTNLRIALFLAGIISSGMAAETVAEESKSTLYASVHIYEVKSDFAESFLASQEVIHSLLSDAPGFVESFQLRATENSNIFMDYIHWQDRNSGIQAVERLVDIAAYSEFAENISHEIASVGGQIIAGQEHRHIDVSRAVVEIAVISLKNGAKTFLELRPTVDEWLEHLRGSQGYVSVQDSTSINKIADIVLWDNLPDALYAADTLENYDFGRTLVGLIDESHYYGHFAVIKRMNKGH